MGSVGFGLEDDSQPHGNLPRKLLGGCGSACHVTVPRKQRSSIEKRAQHGVELRGKDRAKKLKLNMKHGQVTKDEEEVAEALYVLANMFTCTDKVKKPVLFDGTSRTKSAVESEGRGCSMASEEKKPEISSAKVILETAKHSSDAANSRAQIGSIPATLPVTRTPSLNPGTRSHPVGNDTGSVGHTPVKQNKSLKRCCTHIKISHLIKTLKLTENNEDSLEQPTQVATSGEPQSHFSTLDQDGHGDVPSGGIAAHSASVKDTVENKKDIVLYKRSLQDQQPVSETSSTGQRGYNFLSLSSDLDTTEVGDRAGRSHEDPKVSHFHYMQTQNESSQIVSAAKDNSSNFHGNSSVVPAQQAQLPHFMSSTIDGIFSPRIESQQHQWAARFHTQYNSIWGVGATTPLPEWQNGPRNYRLHATLASKYQPTDWSLVPHSDAKGDIHHPRIPSGFGMNGVGLYTENAHQLWLPCNQNP